MYIYTYTHTHRAHCPPEGSNRSEDTKPPSGHWLKPTWFPLVIEPFAVAMAHSIFSILFQFPYASLSALLLQFGWIMKIRLQWPIHTLKRCNVPWLCWIIKWYVTNRFTVKLLRCQGMRNFGNTPLWQPLNTQSRWDFYLGKGEKIGWTLKP